MTNRTIAWPFGAILFVLVLAGCQPQQQVVVTDKPYFDLVGLLDEQLAMFGQEHPQLNKSTQLDGESEQYSTTLDSSGWEEEMAFFMAADLNKPILLDAYEESVEETGDAAVTVYTPKQKKHNGVQRMEIHFADGALEKVVIETLDKNALFTTDRHLELNFEWKGETMRLTDYVVSGTQKMIMKDSLPYRIQGTLLYP